MSDILSAVNAARALYGLAPLAADPHLLRAAQIEADACARSGWLDHQAAGPMSTRITRAGYRWRACGECLAYAGSASEAVEEWLGSPPHRKILLGSYRHAGLAHTGNYWCLDVASPVT